MERRKAPSVLTRASSWAPQALLPRRGRRAASAQQIAPLRRGEDKKEQYTVISRIRATTLGFLVLLAMGSFAASSAYAVAGPFWHHRNNSKEGEGAKIDQPNDEHFQGEGGEQKLKSSIGGTNITITSTSVQVKGVIYNNALQGQIKILLKYHNPKLTEPNFPNCEVKVGENNEVTTFGHLMWKWNGEKKQLEEEKQKEAGQKWDIVFTPAEIEAGATALPEGVFTTIHLTGAECGLLVGPHNVKGSQSVIPEPKQLEEWSKQLNVGFPGWKQQHFWNGKEFIGVEPKLFLGNEPATLTGQVEAHADVQEIAVFER